MVKSDNKKCSILNHKRNLVLAVDFDGTIVDDMWPDIGPLKPNCKEVLLNLHDNYNCDIIIWTCRDKTNGELQPVVKFLTDQGIKFESVNQNTPYIMSLFKNNNPDSRKVFADLYIDDKSLHFANSVRGIVWTDILYYVLKYKNNNEECYNCGGNYNNFDVDIDQHQFDWDDPKNNCQVDDINNNF